MARTSRWRTRIAAVALFDVCALVAGALHAAEWIALQCALIIALAVTTWASAHAATVIGSTAVVAAGFAAPAADAASLSHITVPLIASAALRTDHARQIVASGLLATGVLLLLATQNGGAVLADHLE